MSTAKQQLAAMRALARQYTPEQLRAMSRTEYSHALREALDAVSTQRPTTAERQGTGMDAGHI